MCDFDNGLKFCLCENEKIRFRKQEEFRYVKGEKKIIPNKRNEKIPLIYIWQLFRYAGKYEQLEMGRYQLPTNDIGNGLNEEWIILNLNLTDCFDFNYQPQEGDNLFISQNVEFGNYLSFIFKNGEWKVGHYSPFEDHIRNLKKGKIKSLT